MFNLGRITGVKWQPFKNPTKVKVGAPNIGLKDLLEVGSLLAPGGNLLNLKGLSSLGLRNVGLNGLAGLQGGGKRRARNPRLTVGPTEGATTALGSLVNDMLPVAREELKGMAEMGRNRREQGMRAYNAANPFAVQSAIDAARSRAEADARRAGRDAAAFIGGRSPGLADGLTLDALNRARVASQNIQNEEMGPTAVAERELARLGMLNPDLYSGTLDRAMSGLSGLAGLQQSIRGNRNRQPSAFEQILGIAGQVGGKIDWNKVLKL